MLSPLLRGTLPEGEAGIADNLCGCCVKPVSIFREMAEELEKIVDCRNKNIKAAVDNSARRGYNSM